MSLFISWKLFIKLSFSFFSNILILAEAFRSQLIIFITNHLFSSVQRRLLSWGESSSSLSTFSTSLNKLHGSTSSRKEKRRSSQLKERGSVGCSLRKRQRAEHRLQRRRGGLTERERPLVNVCRQRGRGLSSYEVLASVRLVLISAVIQLSLRFYRNVTRVSFG